MRRLATFLLAACVLPAHMSAAQGLTGALIGTVRDVQGGVIPGAVVRVSSPSLMGGPETLITNRKGQLRFPAPPPGTYILDIEVQGFRAYHEEGVRIGVGATLERTAILDLTGIEESVVVEGAGSRIEARGADSRRGSVLRTSGAFRRGDSACSTSSGPRPASRQPRRQALRPTAFPRSGRAPTRTASTSTARTSRARRVHRSAPRDARREAEPGPLIALIEHC
jgi:hypothetical protein